ncbi:hypothetical protein TNCV_4140551 [Trichonephila clavipes]|nr:hypothetical protein TNCV_4140551 [Trichonephila clavipes]
MQASQLDVILQVRQFNGFCCNWSCPFSNTVFIFWMVLGVAIALPRASQTCSIGLRRGRGVQAQVSSSLLVHGTKLRAPEFLNSATLIFTHTLTVSVVRRKKNLNLPQMSHSPSITLTTTVSECLGLKTRGKRCRVVESSTGDT